MLILGLDPGTLKSGYILYNPDAHTVEDKGIEDNHAILLLMDTYLSTADILAIEMVASYGMSVGRTVFETCVWIGRFVQCYGVEESTILVYRREVKQLLCGTQKAKDTNVNQAIRDMFPSTGKDSKGEPSPVGTKKFPGKLYGVNSHMYPALGVALVAAKRIGEQT